MIESSNPTVLLVDDEEAVTSSLKRALYKHRFRIFTAGSAAEGMARLSSTKIDAIVSDHLMPGTTGVRFLAEAMAAHPDTVRIILSGHADVRVALDAINEARVFRFLTKPCSVETLALAVAEGLDARERHGSAVTCDRAVSASTRTELDRALDDAIQSLWLAMDPIVSTRDSRLFGYEAKAHSAHERLSTFAGLHSAARQLGRCADLDRAVFAAIVERISAAPASIQILTELRPESFQSPELTSPQSPLLPIADRIVFEVGDHDAFQSLPDAKERMQALRACGYRFAVDEMGSGTPALTSLATLRPEFVKFDPEFVRNIERDEVDGEIMRSVVRACAELGIVTIAEGADTGPRLLAVTDCRCDLFQGSRIG